MDLTPFGLGDYIDRARAHLSWMQGIPDYYRESAAVTLGCLRFAGLSESFIHELLYQNHPNVFDGWVAKLRSSGDSDAWDAAAELERIQRVNDRWVVFLVVQAHISHP